jgi:hypothetical protein
MLGLYNSNFQKQRLLKSRFDTLRMQSLLDKLRKESIQKSVREQLKPNPTFLFQVPVPPTLAPSVKPKLSEFEIETSLKQKLLPYMLNLNEINDFIEMLKSTNSLENFDSLFIQFQPKLVGMQRLTAKKIQELFRIFLTKRFQAGNVAGSGVSLKRSGCSRVGGGYSKYMDKKDKKMLIEGLRMAGHNNV